MKKLMTTAAHTALVTALALLVPTTSRSGQAQQPPAGSASRPNIVVFLMDDMGYGDLSFQGHPTINTPNIDRMAREGI